MNIQRRIRAMQTYLRQRDEVLRFEQVLDPRDPRGQRWTLSALLSAALVSMTLLARSLRAAEKLTDGLAGAKFLKRLGINRRVPDSTLGEALASVAPAELLAQLHRQVRAEHRRKALRPNRLPVGVLAVDGKTPAVLDEAANPYYCQQQGSEHGSTRFLYRVLNATLVSSQAAVCIHQMPIAAWTNEMGSFRGFFEGLLSAYARCDLFEVVTSDAGVISREHAGWLNKLGFGYVVALKDNNPELEREARGVLQSLAEHQPPDASDPGFELDSSRGWVKRELWTSTELAGWPGWEHLQQVWLVRVWRKKTKNADVEHIEDRVYATNLRTSHKIRGRHILGVVRGHWRIENELHGTLDIQLREDDPWWVRRGYGLINTGLLRVVAYNLLAIARAVHLRRSKLPGWQELRDWLRDAIVCSAFGPEPANYAPG
jgi:hypothetical protein